MSLFEKKTTAIEDNLEKLNFTPLCRLYAKQIATSVPKIFYGGTFSCTV